MVLMFVSRTRRVSGLIAYPAAIRLFRLSNGSMAEWWAAAGPPRRRALADAQAVVDAVRAMFTPSDSAPPT